ncbi:hypothetical protein AM493_18410 [Flavobacterium akiainvivens]|uniref:DUF4136 domain-containing protein n=1 Tax=Flavobacterium akiainvivens TaxID=1202724 RepID=A0A0M8MFG5_9FLAO|nr:DUF4136 domain-containing protein [Flavobacterium akiainvivens]KOS07804.1 hypothetical protein AM493_18410 [Flavobacterium akiainvivens]SFQ26715.1 protein of unknown function [Flavobacterium akiainvivens]
MKAIKLLPLLLATVFAVSCSSVRVNSDYDEAANFTTFKTYGYLKDGVDKAEISDLDKKRILTAIDAEMAKKGFTKSDKPDFLVNIFTKANKEVNVNNWGGYGGWGYGWGPGWGWGGPWGWGGGYNSVSTHTEGTLYIDVIDTAKKELVWQGVGTGVLTKNREKKQERINEFVEKIIAEFPPQDKK